MPSGRLTLRLLPLQQLSQPQVVRQLARDRAPRALQRDRSVPDHRAHAVAVEQRERAVGDLVGVTARELAVRHPGADLPDEPLVQPGIQLLGDRAKLWMAD